MKMNVSHIVDSISRNAGGVFVSVNRLSQALESSGITISVHGLSDNYSDDDRAEWFPIHPHVHRTLGPRSFGYSPGLTSALWTDECDLMHVHAIWQAQSYSVHSAHRKSGTPYLITPHGMLDSWALSQSRWKKQLAGILYETAHLRDARCLHALCTSELESIRAYGLKNPVCLIPNGVDLPGETSHGARIMGHGGERKKILLFLGRLHPKKGLVNALRAWKEGTDHGSQEEWQFVIAGWDQGGHEEDLKRLCRELGLSFEETTASGLLTRHDERSTTNHSPVTFVGPVFGEAKDALLQQADAFVLPSFSEGLPMAVLEAWAHRLPVLMTDHCNLPEGFAAGAAIRIGTDAGSVAEGLRELSALSHSERVTMGKAGRGLVEEHFTWDKVAAQMKDVYAWMLGAGEKPGCVG